MTSKTLATIPPRESPSKGEETWAEIHDEFLVQMSKLEADVRRAIPNVQVRSGCTSGSSFHQFSYLSFTDVAAGSDPVVAGVTFVPAGLGIRIDADVSGEQGGDLLMAVPKRTTRNSKDELLAAVREVATQLCAAADKIVAALRDPNRRP